MSASEPLRYGSVCSGIEAASVAWHPLGWRPAWFAEVDRFCKAVLEYRWPGVHNYGDFRTITAERGSIDVLVGGTPCQSFSVAGRRAGLADPRGVLAFEFLALAQRLRPRWVVFENVPGLLSSGRGRDFGAFIGTLGQLGYGCSWRVLDAQYFGVPQRRRRVFVVGYLGDWRPALAVLFDPQSLSRHPSARRKAPTGVARGIEIGPSGGRFTDLAPTLDARCKYGAIRNQLGLLAFGGNNTSGPIDIATACRAKGGSGHGDFESETFVTGTLPADYGKQGGKRGVPLVPVGAVPILEPGSRTGKSTTDPRAGIGIGEPGDPMFTLQRGKQHAVAVALRGRDGGGTAELGGEVAHALRAGTGGADKAHVMISGTLAASGAGSARPAGNANETDLVIPRGMTVRRLTPRECERLQGFPDDYTLVPYRKKLAADGPRYRAIGNSMAVPVMRRIGGGIQQVEIILPKGGFECK